MKKTPQALVILLTLFMLFAGCSKKEEKPIIPPGTPPGPGASASPIPGPVTGGAPGTPAPPGNQPPPRSTP